MKATGMIRKMDDLGRVVIPMEIRRTNGWQDKTPLEMFADGQGILLREYRPGCHACGAQENIKEKAGVRLCAACAKELAGV